MVKIGRAVYVVLWLSRGVLKDTKLPEPGAAALKEYDREGYQLLDSVYSGLLKPEQHAYTMVSTGEKSGTSTTKADLLVVNSSAGLVKLFWIDWDGHAKLYETIPAHSRIVQPTYISHVWMVEKENGQSVYVKVNNDPFNVEIK